MVFFCFFLRVKLFEILKREEREREEIEGGERRRWLASSQAYVRYRWTVIYRGGRKEGGRVEWELGTAKVTSVVRLLQKIPVIRGPQG